jgi:hypothetical protein
VRTLNFVVSLRWTQSSPRTGGVLYAVISIPPPANSSFPMPCHPERSEGPMHFAGSVQLSAGAKAIKQKIILMPAEFVRESIPKTSLS